MHAKNIPLFEKEKQSGERRHSIKINGKTGGTNIENRFRRVSFIIGLVRCACVRVCVRLSHVLFLNSFD